MQQTRTQSCKRQSRRRSVHSKKSNRKSQDNTRLKSEQVMAMIAEYYDRHIAPYLEELAPTSRCDNLSKTNRSMAQEKHHETQNTQD